MRKIVIAVCLMSFMAGVVHALSLGNGYAVTVSTSLNLDGVGAYEIKNSQWMTGVSKDLLLLWRKDKKKLYLAGENLFNMGEAGKGAFGLALGTPIGTLADQLWNVIGHVVPEESVPVWVSRMGNWVSIEAGASYRIFGCPEGQTPMNYTIGGKLKIPVENFIKLFGGK